MKKCYSLLRWPAYYRMCSTGYVAVQNKLAAVAPRETITHLFFVSGIGQKKTVDAAKIWRRRKHLLKNRNPAKHS